MSQLKIANSSVNNEDRGYAYDAAWNMHYVTNVTTPATFTVDGKNQLTATTDGANTYDDNGNLVSAADGFATYQYDDENRLVSVELTDYWLVCFYYDGLGRLLGREDYVPSGEGWAIQAVTIYIYDGMRVIQERAYPDTPTVSYTRGSDLSGSLEGAGGIGGLLARSHGYSSGNWTNNNYYHADGNGNITYLVNSSQGLAAKYRYDAYGNWTDLSGPLAWANTYRFSSKMIDEVTGMYYYGYRWYAPYWMRWLNKDPIGERGGINLYTFVLNKPSNEYDIDGRILGRRDRSSCDFWDARMRSPNLCTAAYATAAAVVCRIAGESPWEQCQRWCLQWTYTTAGQNCCSAASTAAFIAATAARYAACAAACAIDTGTTLPPIPPLPPIPRF